MAPKGSSRTSSAKGKRSHSPDDADHAEDDGMDELSGSPAGASETRAADTKSSKAAQPDKKRKSGKATPAEAQEDDFISTSVSRQAPKDRRKSAWQAQEDDDGFTFSKKVQPGAVPAPAPPKPIAKAVDPPKKALKEKAKPVMETPQKIERTIDMGNISLSSYTSMLPPSTRDAILPLPPRDTPAANRNKEMRNRTNAGGPRRSSLGSRGRRSSAALNGLCHMPHEDVPTEEFYRHIQDDMPEPLKMKQLLFWCAELAMNGRPGGDYTADVLSTCASIEAQVIDAIKNNKVDCSWLRRKKDPRDERTVVMKPNPKNIKNQQKLAKLEQTMKKLQNEEEMWKQLQRERSMLHAAAVDSVPDVTSSREIDAGEKEPWLADQLDENQRALLNKFANSATGETGKEIRDAIKNLGVEVDQIFHDVYKLTVFEDVTRRYNDDLYSKLLKAYDLRSRLAEPTQEPEPMDLLRALSQVPAS